jgi:predicted DNA binding CopG/RHH family protein
MATEELPGPPRFKTEKEEAEWWDSNQDYILQQFKRAKANGTLGHGTQLRLAKEKLAAKSTTIRLDEGDLSLAKKQAESKGLRYQTYVKMLLHEALQKEEKHSA